MLCLFLLISFNVFCQNDEQILLLGNYDSVCAESPNIQRADSLPESLDNYNVVMLFSNASSTLSNSDVHRIIEFTKSGGGLYCGAENWPLQAESNQVTRAIYLKESFGNYEEYNADTKASVGNLSLDTVSYLIPAGSTTVAFPMDHRLKVEAWVQDQPLILSGTLQEGRVIIDGGYSRFYCNQRSEESDQLLKLFLRYLARPTKKKLEKKR